jgi:hypothetical protein
MLAALGRGKTPARQHIAERASYYLLLRGSLQPETAHHAHVPGGVQNDDRFRHVLHQGAQDPPPLFGFRVQALQVRELAG